MSEPVVPLRPTPKQKPNRNNTLPTEDAAATLFASRYHGKLLYDHHTGSWFVWTGERWQREETGLAFHWARNLAHDLVCDADDKTKRAVEKSAFAGGVERFAKADPTFAVTSDGWDVDQFVLGTPAGTVDLTSGAVRPAHPGDRITKLTAVSPSDAEDCPRWLQFLDETTGGDSDLIEFLRLWAGYCLTGSTKEHALVFIHGLGGNGKSVWLNTLGGILGDYATTAAMDTFVASTFDSHPTELARLRGARLVTASETEEGRTWAEARLKSLTGGDRIAARFMRRDFFEFAPQFKLMFAGNHKPSLRNIDDAIRRRLFIVPFTRKPENPDRDLETKLRAEWPGILRWAINGCLEWKCNGLNRPEIVRAETDAYLAEQDTFGQWLEDRCDVEPGNPYKWETVASLFADWKAYAERAGEKPGSSKHFSNTMRTRGFDAHRGGHGGVRQFRGLRFKSQSGDDGDR